MKTILSFLLCFLPGSIFSQVPEPYASFPFNGDFNDEKENVTAEISPDCNITFVNDPYRGTVAYFPGNDTLIDEKLNFINLSLNAADFDAVSYAIWINADEILTWSRIITCATTDPDGIYPEFFVTPANGRLFQQLGFTFDYNKGPLGDQADDAGKEIPGGLLTAGIWYFITVAQDAAHLKLWINAEPKGDSVNSSGKTPADCEYPTVMLGKSGWPDPLFKGKMDNFRIWDCFLTDEEVKSLYFLCCEPDGIATRDKEIAIKVFPNPVKSNITIDIGQPFNPGECSVQIFNSTGLQVFSAPLVQKISNFELSDQSGKGIYLLKITDNLKHAVTFSKIVF